MTMNLHRSVLHFDALGTYERAVATALAFLMDCTQNNSRRLYVHLMHALGKIVAYLDLRTSL